jgi:folylpolyglutamate synthase/dihydropteroate synthase
MGNYAICCVAPDAAAAWNIAAELADPDDLVCITGSFFIAAEMRRQMEIRPLR